MHICPLAFSMCLFWHIIAHNPAVNVFNSKANVINNLIKCKDHQLVQASEGASRPAVHNPGLLRLPGSPGVHRDTCVIQSYFIFCAGSQDRYYNAGIKPWLNRWPGLVQRVNFWPPFFLTPIRPSIAEWLAAQLCLQWLKMVSGISRLIAPIIKQFTPGLNLNICRFGGSFINFRLYSTFTTISYLWIQKVFKRGHQTKLIKYCVASRVFNIKALN